MAESRHTTSIALSVLDQATQTLRRMQSEFARTRQSAARMGSGARSALGGTARFGLGVFSSAARVALGAATSLARGGLGLIADAGMAALSVTKRLAAATLALGLAITLTTAQVTRSSVELAANRQAQEQGLENILGSADAAAFALERLKAIGRLPGISFDQAIQGFSALSSVNVDFELALGLIGEFGNAVALSGGSVEELSFALRGLSQMFGKGKVSAEELNQQILEQAPIIRRAIQAAWGTADTELITKRLEKQKLTITDFWTRTLEEMRKLPRAGDGAKNALENLVISWNEMRIAAGRGFMTGGFAGQLAALTEWIERMTPKAEQLGRAFRVFLDRQIARIPELLKLLKEVGGADFYSLSKRTTNPFLHRLLLDLERAKPTVAAIWDELLRGDWDALGGRLQTGLLRAWAAAKPVLVQIGKDLWASVNETLFGHGDKGSPLVDPKMWDQVKSIFAIWLETAKAIGPDVLSAIKAVATEVGEALRGIPRETWQGMADGIAAVVHWMAEFTKSHPQFVAGLLLISQVAGPLLGLLGGLVGLLGTALTLGRAVVGMFAGSAAGAAGAAGGAAGAGAAGAAAAGAAGRAARAGAAGARGSGAAGAAGGALQGAVTARGAAAAGPEAFAKWSVQNLGWDKSIKAARAAGGEDAVAAFMRAARSAGVVPGSASAGAATAATGLMTRLAVGFVYGAIAELVFRFLAKSFKEGDWDPSPSARQRDPRFLQQFRGDFDPVVPVASNSTVTHRLTFDSNTRAFLGRRDEEVFSRHFGNAMREIATRPDRY